MPFQLIVWNLEISLEYFFLKNDFNKGVFKKSNVLS